MNITTSMLRAFKSCRRLYELQYIERLKPRIEPDALAIGSSYHNLIEGLLKGLLKGEDRKGDGIAQIMADRFKELILPKLTIMREVEYEFKVQISEKHNLIGKIDAITLDGIPVEHKTTSDKIDEKYIYRLNWDDQVTNYLLALSLERKEIITKAIYTAIQKPTIRLKQKETPEEYLLRCAEWYNEDTETKIGTFPVVRSKDELIAKQEELIYMCDEIEKCHMYYKNPSHCSIMGCSYSGICLSYTPEIGAIDFVKKEKINEELSKTGLDSI